MRWYSVSVVRSGGLPDAVREIRRRGSDKPLMRKEVDRSAMIRLFEEIRDAFPRLSMRLDQNPRNVDLNVDIPQQPGLAFDVNLNLQGDELHLSAGAFWLEWFPSTRPDVVQAYREAVHGLLSGTYRIRERYRGGRPFRAELQKPDQSDWRTIGTWYGWSWPLPRRTFEKVLQNVTDVGPDAEIAAPKSRHQPAFELF